MTLSDRLHLTNGRPAGFDYMRVVLAFMIVVWHTAIVSYGIEAQRSLISAQQGPCGHFYFQCSLLSAASWFPEV